MSCDHYTGKHVICHEVEGGLESFLFACFLMTSQRCLLNGTGTFLGRESSVFVPQLIVFCALAFFSASLYSRMKGIPEFSISIKKSRRPAALGEVSENSICLMSRIPSGMELWAMIWRIMIPCLPSSRSALFA